MMAIRPVRMADLDALEALAHESGPGMTNLPPDRALLAERIRASERGFSREVQGPGDESYLMVAEDAASGAIAGTTGIIASVGLTKPFYSYQIISVAHSSQELRRYETVRLLQLVNEYRGATEIATLYLGTRHRGQRLGPLLSRCRFLLMAQHPQRFAPQVMAEMRGVHDARGRSRFWDSLGRHFFDMDFSKADFLSSQGRYQFIADLMPSYPIYVRLLPKAAQAVIGVPHADTRPAMAMLEAEGFRFEGLVDVFDAGPAIHAPRDQIHSVRASRLAAVGSITRLDGGLPHLVANTRLDGFRACRTALVWGTGGRATIAPEAAAALEVAPGDEVRVVPA